MMQKKTTCDDIFTNDKLKRMTINTYIKHKEVKIKYFNTHETDKNNVHL